MTRYFVRYLSDGDQLVPRVLYRREVEDDTQSDAHVKSGEWIPKPYSQFDEWMRGWGDVEFEEVSARRAEEFLEMSRTRNFHPFTTP